MDGCHGRCMGGEEELETEVRLSKHKDGLIWFL